MKSVRTLVVLLLAALTGVVETAAFETPPFDFNAPPGPEFVETEKTEQRERGRNLTTLIREAFDENKDSVVVPPGDYRFGKSGRGKQGRIYGLDFRGMKRTADKPFRIIAKDATFWFELPPEQAPTCYFAVGFVDCANLTLEGATLDRDGRACMEGRITRIDDENGRIEIEASKGSFVPTTFSNGTEQRIIPFNADGTFCTALYKLQHVGPDRLKYESVKPSEKPGCYWVEFPKNSKLLECNRDPAWHAVYGDAGTLQVGDGLHLIYATTHAVSVQNCDNLQFIGIKNHIPKGCLSHVGGKGGHLWKDYYSGPRPGTNQWQGGDGIMSGRMERGCTVDGAVICHATDDPFNFHGYWAYVESTSGNSITIVGPLKMPVETGDVLNFFKKDDGAFAGRGTVESVGNKTITLREDATGFFDCVAENPKRQDNDFVIRNCKVFDCYQRVLIQGGNGGVIENNYFARLGHSVELNSNFFTNNEGGICRDIRITNNIFEDVAVYPGAVTLDIGFSPLNKKSASRLVERISVERNRFSGSGRHAVRIRNARDCNVADNELIDIGRGNCLLSDSAKGEVAPVLIE